MNWLKNIGSGYIPLMVSGFFVLGTNYVVIAQTETTDMGQPKVDKY